MPNIEGPFFKPNAPHRDSLVEPGDVATPLVIRGSVSDTGCRPVSNATLEVWQADGLGHYDNEGFAYRTRFAVSPNGSFQLRSVVPGRYLNGSRYRPSHIHLKVLAPGFASLTTQLYFDGDPFLDGDPFMHPSLIMSPTPLAEGLLIEPQLVIARS